MVKPYRKIIVVVTILAIIINACELIKPLLIEQVLDNYLPQKTYIYNNITITTIGIVYIALVIIGNVIDYINRYITNKMGEDVLFNLRNKLYKYIENASVKFHDKTPSGKLFVRITSDTEDVYSLFSEVITTFLKDIIIIITIFVIMIVISAKLSMINIIIVPLLLVTTITINTMMRKIYDKSKKVRTRLNTFLAESIYGIKLIKIFNRQKEKQIECEENTLEHYNTTKKLGILYGILPAALNLIQNLGIAMIVVFCANNWLGIQLEVGIIYLFITYLKKIFNPIDRIIENMEIVEDAFSSIDKIYEILEHEELLEDKASGKILENVKGKIEFKNVWFAYDSKNWILKNVSFTIEPGQSIALVGKTGSRKNNYYQFN